MGKITGLWLTVMMLLAVVATSTPLIGAGVAAASNHETDIQVRDAGLVDKRVDSGQMNTPEPELWVTLENTGGTEGTVPITVAVGGREVRVIDSDEATVGPGNTTNVTVTYVLETKDGGYIDDGEHAVTVNGEPAGTLVVGQSNITITDLSWNTTTVGEGEAVALTVTAENTGAVSGQQDVFTYVDGTSVSAVSFRLEPGETGSDEYVHTFEEAGKSEFGTSDETRTITVGEPPTFDTTDRQLNRSMISEGEAVNITATVTNTGDQRGSFEVPFTIDSETEVTRNVTLDGDESTVVSYTRSFDSSGTYTVDVAGDQAGAVEVTAPAAFEVQDAQLSSDTVTEGESVDVTATVMNSGTESGTFEAELVVDSDTVDTQSIEVGPDSSQQVSFTRSFDDSGERTISVNDATAGTLTVEAADDGGGAGPPDVQVQDAELIDKRVDSGQMTTPTPKLWMTLENTGGSEGTVPITVAVGGREVTVIGSDEATVGPGNTTNVTVTYVLETDDGGYIDDGEHAVTVNGEPAGTLVVGQSNITITDLSWNTTTVTQGEAVALTVTAENTGAVSGQQDVFTYVDGTSVSAVSFYLEPGEASSDTYVHTFEEAGEFEFGTFARTRTITVQQPATFEVTDRELSNKTVSEGESVEATATITNTGDQPGTYETTLTVADNDQNSTEVELDAGETTTVSLLTEPFGAVGTYPIDLDGERVDTVRVSEEATFETTDVTLNRTDVVTGEPIAVTATVRNEGDQDGSADVRLQEDGNTIDTQSVTLDGGEETNVTFVKSFTTAGDRAIAVDNQFGARVTVSEPATFEVSNAQVSSESIIEGGSVAVSMMVTNTGGQEGTFESDLSVANSVEETQNVTLAGGEATEITYEHTFNSSGNYVVDVSNKRAGTVTVKEPATFDTTDTALNRTDIGTGDPVAVSATITNRGDEDGTSPVRLQANDDILNTTNVTLSGGEQTEVAFVHVFESGGDYEVAVNNETGGNIFVTQPATFEVQDTQLSNDTVTEGESVEVTATITNVGTENGTYDAELGADGQTLKSRSIGPIQGGETETVTFSASFDSDGTRSLTIGGVAAGNLSVEAESSSDDDDGGGGGGGGGGGFSSSSDNSDDSNESDGGGAQPPAISQSQLDNGVSLRVSQSATNTTSTTVSQSLNLSGPSETAPSFALSALSLELANESDGFNTTLLGPHATPHNMTAVRDDSVLGYVTVTSGANASAVRGVSYAVTLNETAFPSTDSTDGVQVFQYHNGTWSELDTTATNRSIRANATQLSTIAVVSPATKETEGGAATSPITASPSELTISNASLTADWVRAGFNTTAHVSVENPTNETVEQTVTVTVDGDAVASRTVQLGPNEQTSLSFEFEAADGTVTVNGVKAGDLRVGTDQTDSTSSTDASDAGRSSEQETTETANASGPGFTVQLVAVILALVAGVARLRRL